MNAQITFKITKLPENKENSRIFLASSLNNWNPGDQQFEFKKINGFYTLTIPNPSQKIEYKITQPINRFDS